MSNKKIKIKVWAIFWRKGVWENYGITLKDSPIVGCDTISFIKRIKGTMRYKKADLWADVVAFKRKRDAVLFIQGNKDWEVKLIEIEFIIN